MTEEKLFLRWMVFVLFIILSIGKGIPAALIMWVPEPLPKLAPATELSILNGWEYHGEALAKGWTSAMDIQYLEIEREAMDVAGVSPIRCGRMQYDIDPFTGRIAMN